MESNFTAISKSVDDKKNKQHRTRNKCALLTERSFHVIGLTCLGIPDQLSFRSSSGDDSKHTRGFALDLQQRLETERVLFAQQRLDCPYSTISQHDATFKF